MISSIIFLESRSSSKATMAILKNDKKKRKDFGDVQRCFFVWLTFFEKKGKKRTKKKGWMGLFRSVV